MKLRLETIYTLTQPLSHIGESESNVSFLNTIRIRNGSSVTECAVFTGNALRGIWRDHGAVYLLDRLGIKVPKTAFHLLFSGGSINGAQVIDLSKIKQMRALVPLVSVFGGGIGKQLLQGKFTQTFAYPVCAETIHVIPNDVPGIDYTAQALSWRQLTGQIAFSRHDDSKGILSDTYLRNEELSTLDNVDYSDDNKRKKSQRKSTNKLGSESDAVSTQMRFETEYLVPSTQLWHALCFDGTDVELGALVSCIHHWANNPSLGGKGASGFGGVDLVMSAIDPDGARTPFITVKDGHVSLSPIANDAKLTYDAVLDDLTVRFSEQDYAPLVNLLDGVSDG